MQCLFLDVSIPHKAHVGGLHFRSPPIHIIYQLDSLSHRNITRKHSLKTVVIKLGFEWVFNS